MPTPSLAERVLKHVETMPEGALFDARALAHIGARPSVNRALARLVRRGELLRAARGLYLRPLQGRPGVRPPASTVIEALVRQSGEVLVPSGALAAIRLGLSDAPAREVYLTQGRSRRLRCGAHLIELRHAAPWQLVMPGRPAGDAVRAFAWFGPKQAAAIAETVRKTLPQEELRALLDIRDQLPDWIRAALDKDMRQ